MSSRKHIKRKSADVHGSMSPKDFGHSLGKEFGVLRGLNDCRFTKPWRSSPSAGEKPSALPSTPFQHLPNGCEQGRASSAPPPAALRCASPNAASASFVLGDRARDSDSKPPRTESRVRLRVRRYSWVSRHRDDNDRQQCHKAEAIFRIWPGPQILGIASRRLHHNAKCFINFEKNPWNRTIFE
jgi:hypothetical protein